MSSRAAASRKRLVPGKPGEEKRPSSSKGLFSRSKSILPAPRMEIGRSYSSPVHSDVPSPFHAGYASQALDDSYMPFDLSAKYSHPSPIISRPMQKPAAKPAVGTVGVASYPSPPHDDLLPMHSTPSYQIRVEGRSAVGPAFLEASYQPPPPPRVNVQRALPPKSPPPSNVPMILDSLSPFPSPPSYPPPIPSLTRPTHSGLPSPASSPRKGPIVLQYSSRNHSPTPTEPPTYSFTQQSRPSSPQIGRPPLQLAIQNTTASSQLRPEHLQYLSPPYASPPSPNRSPRNIPAALDLRESRSNERIDLSSPPPTTVEGDRKPWYRNLGASAPSSPARSSFPAGASPHVRVRPPESIAASESSESSGGKSTSVAETPSPTFIFPGSRSVARPKVSSKNGTPKFKVKEIGKSRKRKDSNGQATSPIAPSPDALSRPTATLPLATPSSPKPIFNSNGNGVPSVTVQQAENTQVVPVDSHSISETASAFSDDSGEILRQARQRKLSAASSASGNGAFVYPVSRSRGAPRKPPTKIKPLTQKGSAGKLSDGNDDREERTRFMGILIKKKKKSKGEDSSGSNTLSSGSEFSGDHFAPQRGDFLPSAAENGQNYEQEQEALREQSRQRAKKIKSRIGNYPLDPYDSVLLDNDRHTGELLTRLNPTSSPSFHNYGNSPPTSVLDLGCGQGHWVVDAAIAWKGYGTKVTGYDMVDISKALRPWATEQGVAENIRFVRGNFLKQRLPFSDSSFDLVRMSCLALCITSDSWIFVLQEVSRVLMVGGRLELIDDLIFFPYGKSSSMMDNTDLALPQPESVAPRLDITIPSSTFTTFSIYDGDTTNPGLGLPSEQSESEDLLELYGVEEEADVDDTATINGDNVNSVRDPYIGFSAPRTGAADTASNGLSPRSWNRAYATSKDLEALFEHMLAHKFGVHKDPSDFILDLMKDVFGHAREVKTMQITLAPSVDSINGLRKGHGSSDSLTINGLRSNSTSRRQSMGLSQTPGLILWPSTFIPMDQSEIEIHASKHFRMLISCKNYLLEHAIEATEDEEIDEESVLEALWEYESFLRHRFNPPFDLNSPSVDKVDQNFDAASVRGSIAESVSSDGMEAMWEIQSEFRQRFAWSTHSRSGSTSSFVSQRDRPATPSTPQVQDNTPTASAFFTSTNNSSPASLTSSTATAPMYSREELTHVRTFRIYEAIKMDETFFKTAI